MRGATAHKHYSRLAGVQREIFRLCRISGESLAWLLAARQRRVYEDPAFGKIPAYYREILSALWHEEFDRLHRPDIYLNEYNALGAAAPGKFPPRPMPPVAATPRWCVHHHSGGERQAFSRPRCVEAPRRHTHLESQTGATLRSMEEDKRCLTEAS